MNNFHPFIIPFCVGTIILFVILLVFFLRWLFLLDKKQRNIVLKNIISLKSCKAIIETIRECLFHHNIFKINPILGYMHLSFAFGWFLLIVIGKIETTFYSQTFWDEPWLAIFFRYFENTDVSFKGVTIFTFLMDFCLLFILSGLLLAFIKRFYSKIVGLKKTTKHTLINRIALSALWCIFPLRLLAESVTAGLKNNGGFLTQSLGNILSFLPLELLQIPLWWLYSIALCVFFIFLPFTRYMHIFTEILLIFLRKWGVTETNNKTGFTEIELNACSCCGICIDVCPLNTEANINDVQSVYFIKDARNRIVNEHVINNCLMCGRCTKVCPVGLDSTKIRQIYRKKHEYEQENYFQFINDKPNIQPYADVIYFAGCMTHLTNNIIVAMKNIFNAANVKYWFIDEDKTICCGRPLIQQGFDKQANTLKEKNIQLILQSGIKTLITSCPICFQSFTKEYNLDIEILHHSQYIERLIKSGKLKVNKSTLKTAYHDPCELGRGCNIYEAPRNVLNTVTELVPTALEKENSLCCGYNLANTALELDNQMKIKNKTYQNLTANNPDVVATACPMCKRAFQHGTNAQIKDIAELVNENLKI